jgi:hypothetical protein
MPLCRCRRRDSPGTAPRRLLGLHWRAAVLSTGRILTGVTDERSAESLIDRLLLALAAQLAALEDPALAAGAVEALAELGRAEADLIFGQAGHLVHYGADMEPLEALIRMISASQRGEASSDAVVRAGDEVRLVGELPDSLAHYNETMLREMIFVVRYVGKDETVAVQPYLNEDYVIETVPIANVKSVLK